MDKKIATLLAHLSTQVGTITSLVPAKIFPEWKRKSRENKPVRVSVPDPHAKHVGIFRGGLRKYIRHTLKGKRPAAKKYATNNERVQAQRSARMGITIEEYRRRFCQ